VLVFAPRPSEEPADRSLAATVLAPTVEAGTQPVARVAVVAVAVVGLAAAVVAVAARGHVPTPAVVEARLPQPHLPRRGRRRGPPRPLSP
jgi:hypothetical protein